MDVAAIVLAAGQGKRMKSDTNKQYLLLEGKPVLAHTLQAFEDSDLISEVIVVARADELAFCAQEVVAKYAFKKVSKIVKGGKEHGQGVAYLEDGTMIVVDGGRRFIGQMVTITVTSVLQTAAGRMIFARTKSLERIV